MAQTEHWPRHHAVEASAFAISSCICMKISSGASAPPRLCGSSERYSPFSTKADTTGGVRRRVRSISSASRRISGASARARSTRSKLGSLFMRFLAFFWLLTGRERNGGPSAAADQGGAKALGGTDEGGSFFNASSPRPEGARYPIFRRRLNRASL